MSMLAERRRKTKWTLNPGRQALWNKDDSYGIKFGQGLMEKMGWKVGQGLGVNQQGIKEPLKIDIKNDNKGMGFKDNDNEWIHQQHEFNDLLSKLSSSNNITEKYVSKSHEKTYLSRSLEEKSRHSKTRVHYHKFTRGKDLTKYSEKDLECILGSKKELTQDIIGIQENGDTYTKLPESTSTIIYGGSMVDYFKEKMQKKVISKSMKSLKFINKGQDLVMGNENDLEGLKETDAVTKNVKKKGDENENNIKSCKTLGIDEIDGNICEDLPHIEKKNDFKQSLHDQIQKSNNKKINLNSGKMMNCLQSLNYKMQKNPEESSDKVGQISSPNFAEHNTHILKKKREEETEDEKKVIDSKIGWTYHLKEKEIIHRKNKKLNENSIDNSNDNFRCRKKIKTAEDEKRIINDTYTGMEEHRVKSKKKKKSKIEKLAVDDESKCENFDDINLISCTGRSITRRLEKIKKDCETTSTYEESCVRDKCENENKGKEISKKERSKFVDPSYYKSVFLNKGTGISDNSEGANTMFTSIPFPFIENFRGSNLDQVKGYGFLRKIKNKRLE